MVVGNCVAIQEKVVAILLTEHQDELQLSIDATKVQEETLEGGGLSSHASKSKSHRRGDGYIVKNNTSIALTGMKCFSLTRIFLSLLFSLPFSLKTNKIFLKPMSTEEKYAQRSHSCLLEEVQTFQQMVPGLLDFHKQKHAAGLLPCTA